MRNLLNARPATPATVAEAPKTVLPADEENDVFKMVGGKISLKKSIDFDANSAVMDQGDKRVISRLADLFRRYPDTGITLVGFTHGMQNGKWSAALDDDPSPKMKDVNGVMVGGTLRQLSEWRAHAVGMELAKMGIAESRMSWEGRGTDGRGKRTEITCTAAGGTTTGGGGHANCPVQLDNLRDRMRLLEKCANSVEESLTRMANLCDAAALANYSLHEHQQR
jgi:outer membrane protein OmpA-like peptidoglycan-associated protein